MRAFHASVLCERVMRAFHASVTCKRFIRAFHTSVSCECFIQAFNASVSCKMLHLLSLVTVAAQALETAERKAKPPFGTMFEDVYKAIPPHLLEQREHLMSHLKKHKGCYDQSP